MNPGKLLVGQDNSRGIRLHLGALSELEHLFKKIKRDLLAFYTRTKPCKMSKKIMNSAVTILALSVCLAPAVCQFEPPVMVLKDVITDAAAKLAESAGTELDRSKLASGTCLSENDDQTGSACKDQGEAKVRASIITHAIWYSHVFGSLICL